jgi:uncharacterized DUF497 family protein
MDGIRFTWDDRKDRSNQRKHGVSFEEATTAFADENARLKHDPDHSEDEAIALTRIEPELLTGIEPFSVRDGVVPVLPLDE